jgi:hypothetical protein
MYVRWHCVLSMLSCGGPTLAPRGELILITNFVWRQLIASQSGFLWGAPGLFGLAPNAAMYLGLVFTIPGARKRDAVESLIMTMGAEAGFGKGMISGSMMNFRAVINVRRGSFERSLARSQAPHWRG